MAQFQVSPPEKFLVKADKWTKWIKRFERFCIASVLGAQEQGNQGNALIYSMGEEAEDILVSLHLTVMKTGAYARVEVKLEPTS